ncbi:MAG: hypothetical protein ACRC35_07915 [Angustibacter sp.]
MATHDGCVRGFAAGQTIMTGRDLPAQLHLSQGNDPWKVSARDSPADSQSLAVKPVGALWTSPATGHSPAGHRTAWSQMYYRHGYDLIRRRGMSRWERLRSKARPERLWPVVPDPDMARILRLQSLDDLVIAAQEWPTRHGHLSFEALAQAGIDAVWVQPGAITRSWADSDFERPHGLLCAQMYGWDVESVAWLRPEHIRVGAPLRADRDRSPAQGTSGPGIR